MIKGILCTGYSDEPAFQIGELPTKTPGPREVLVEVHAAAVSFMDLLMAQGKYQMLPALPFVPGTDAAGVVRAVGAEVTRFRVRDRVVCGGWHGAWAEQRVSSEDMVSAVPDDVDLATAASLRYAYGTARYALTLANVKAGETLFVSGAAGGVGLASVDLGRHLGARVIAGVSTPEKAATVRAYGAHEVVVYGEENLRDRVKALTEGRGVDICLDNVGGNIFDAMARLMSWGGRLLPIGFTSGEIPSLPANLPLLKNYSVVGAFWGAWAERFPRESSAADEALMGLVSTRELRPLVSRVLPWQEFPDALAAIRTRQVQGRVVLAMRPFGDPRPVQAAASSPML